MVNLNTTIRNGLSFIAAGMLTMSVVTGEVHAEDDTVARTASSGELRACFADDNPWAFKDPSSGSWQGFVPDLARDLAAAMEVKLVEVDAGWATLIQNLQTDKCDIIAAPLFATVERNKAVLFTNPYAYEYATVYVHSDSPYKTYEEIDQDGKVIAVRAGTSHIGFAENFFKHATIKTYLAENSMALVADVAAKRVDGWLDSYIATGTFLSKNPQFPVRPIGANPLEPVQVVWAIKLGNYHFQQLVNTFLFSHIADGKMSVLWEKWFGTKYERPRL